jgi:signal peptidase I
MLSVNKIPLPDSRYWGFVEQAAVKGKAYTIYWSWDRENSKVRWNRIGKKIE